MFKNKASRTYNFDIKIMVEAGSVLGIIPHSNYTAILSQKDVKAAIASDMRNVGCDIRRAANMLGVGLYPSGETQAEVSKKIGRSKSAGEAYNSGFRKGSEQASFEKYANLYWATKS
ncbi:hypothetical protein [Rahnella sp. NRRL B-41462]|uniref:hypothetical protein n=1 Tax=Rahnella sp. NRRL B-41462 TaxID=1610579 RepID=UPI00130037BC|nr:hypothetical protein [Rahnella sp. NRRL B-41462]